MFYIEVLKIPAYRQAGEISNPKSQISNPKSKTPLLPVLFHIGSVPIYSYGFCIMLGMIANFMYVRRQTRHWQWQFTDLVQLFLGSIIAAIIGGKVFLWFENTSISDSFSFDFLSGRGFVFYGSLVFCVLFWYLFARRKHLNFLLLCDVLVIGGLIVQIFGKAGCFFAGCCYGIACAPHFGLIYHDPLSAAFPLHAPLFPVQLLEWMLLVVMLFVLLSVNRKSLFDGQIMLLYGVLYGSARFFTEFLRGDDDRGFMFGATLSHAQFVSLLMVPAAAVLYFILSRRPL